MTLIEPQLYFIYLSPLKEEFTHRQISDIAHRCVLYIASRDLETPVESLRLVSGKYGKPYIKDHENWHFNISHKDKIIAIVVSDKPVGIDVERICKADFRIAKRFFTKKENAYINELNTKRDERFFEIWTKKEAYLKYIGEGVRKPLDSFDVTENSKIYKTTMFGGYIITICSKDAHEFLN